MKLHSLTIHKSGTCDGLLDGLHVSFHQATENLSIFSPLCLIGPNGSGKSQILQIIAEIFQMVYANYLPSEELGHAGDDIEFEIEYSLASDNELYKRVKITRKKVGKRKPVIKIEVYGYDNWEEVKSNEDINALLPLKIIGYTSGNNETLSIPFLVSKAGYAKAVTYQAINTDKTHSKLNEPRLMFIDYGTNLEVLLANLLLNSSSIRKSFLGEFNLKSLRSFRCVIQLNHAQAPAGGIQLTKELKGYLYALIKCSTKNVINEAKGIYELDFFVNEATHKAFKHYWKKGALDLYSSFHKLAMLNDLIIPKSARQAFANGLKKRRFSSRLPEPYEEYKAFRFENVEFVSEKSNNPVDYVSLSDGEHQLAQLLGVACMACEKNTLFLLDEPESHFNPNWRIEFISKFINQKTKYGMRKNNSEVSIQDCLITTHSPFVPSDMKSENVLIFNKNKTNNIEVRRPNIETYGSTFDTILEECFDVSPPMSAIPKAEIEMLLKSDDIDLIVKSMKELGDSVDLLYLADRVRLLKSKKD